MRKIYDEIIFSDVLVKHPFEPVRCKRMKADIVIFLKDLTLNHASIFEYILAYNYNIIRKKELNEIYGIYILQLFHDKSLRKCIFEYSKEFFEYYSALKDYEYYYKKYIGE